MAAVEAEDASDASVAGALRDKTAALIDRVRGWFPDGVPTSADGVAAFKERCRTEGFNAPMERFTWALLQVEGRAAAAAAAAAVAS